MGGRFLVPLAAEHRVAAGVTAGEEVHVSIELDGASREVSVPTDLHGALAADDDAMTNFWGLAYSHRKEWVRWVEEAERPDTRSARITTTVEALHLGKRTR